MRKVIVGLTVAATMLVVTPAAANHDWAAGCSRGNSCWWESQNGGGFMQSDHRDSWTFNDRYVGNTNQTIGNHTDWFRNRMTSTHAHLFALSGYWSNGPELFCVNPNSDVWYWVGNTDTGSWLGHSGWYSGCLG